MQTAIRFIPASSVPDPNPLWVGPPRAYPEEDTSDPSRTFLGAALQCEPYFRDWSTLGTVYVFGSDVVPDAEFDLHTIQDCATSLQAPQNFSARTRIRTGKWGDVVSLFEGDDPGAPQPDFIDVSAIVAKFMADPAAPIKAQAQLQPNIVFPARPIDFKDIAADVSAFIGTSYDGAVVTAGCTCPSTVTCGATACGNDLDCSGGLCVDGFCADACGRCAP
jgi:hypothetical protein